MDLSVSLDQLMRSKGLSQYRLAEMSGVPQPTIQRIVSGETKSPKTVTIQALSEAMSVSVSELLDGSWASDAVKALKPLAAWDDTTPMGDDEVAIPFYKEVEMSAGHGSSHAVELNHRKLRFSRATLLPAGSTKPARPAPPCAATAWSA